ncbi:MAG TPA: sugar transferase, partial [Candidatus Dormibacteraeota bacterium]|nr:sugar transferase [Candidatus Dormibacteraeota bacterium]
MSKIGEAWIKSPEKRAFEVATVGSLLPAIGGTALTTAILLSASQKHDRVTHYVSRSLYPGHVFSMQKLGDPDSNSRVQRWCHQAMIDELPQALDVLGGSMSLFGPRADKPAHIVNLFGSIEGTELHKRWLEVRSEQKPGIISSYSVHSHAHNLEGTPEYVRFSGSEEEILRQNAIIRAELDVQDFEQASFSRDRQ